MTFTNKFFLLLLPVFTFLVWGYSLRIEANYDGYSANDCQQHRSYVEATYRALQQGQLPLEIWGDHCCLGAPIFRSYQYLSHLVAASLMKISGRNSSWAIHFLIVVFLLLQYPAVFFAARVLGLSLSASAFSAILFPLLGGPGLGSLSIDNYIFNGMGMFAQISALPTLYLSIAFSFLINRCTEYKSEMKLLPSQLCLSCLITLTFLFHHYVGFIAVLFYLVSGFVGLAARWLSLRQFLIQSLFVGGSTLIMTSHQLLSMWQDSALVFKNTWERTELWEGHSIFDVLAVLFDGSLLDGKGTQLLSALTLVGFLGLLKRSSPRALKTFGVAFLTGLFLIMGSRGIGKWAWETLFTYVQSDRMIILCHVSAVFLAGYGLAIALNEVSDRLKDRFVLKNSVLLLFFAIVSWVHYEQILQIKSGAMNIERQKHSGVGISPELLHSMGDKNAHHRFWIDHASARFYLGTIPMISILSEEGFAHAAVSEHSMIYGTEMPRLFDPKRKNDYEVFDVNRVVLNLQIPAPSFLEPLYEDAVFRVYKAPNRGLLDVIQIPKVSFVSQELDFRNAVQTWLQKAKPLQYDAAIPVELQKKWPQIVPTPFSDGLVDGSVLHQSEFDNREISAEFESNKAGQYGVFKMNFHPNWKVWVNGNQTPTQIVGPGYLAFALPPGKSEVRIQFTEDRIRILLFYLGITMFLSYLAFLFLFTPAPIPVFKHA